MREWGHVQLYMPFCRIENFIPYTTKMLREKFTISNLGKEIKKWMPDTLDYAIMYAKPEWGMA